ncbi:GT4 family glycosyltransferase PelF [Streptomyces sp. NPDC003016]
MSRGLHVSMLTEGTYPHVQGGVSTWCDQLVRGMPDIGFHVVSLTGTGREPVTWELPGNVHHHTTVPLWGAETAGGKGPRRGPRPFAGRERRRFLATYERFLLAVLDPEAGCDFGHELYALAALARQGRLTTALRTEAALRTLTGIWTMRHLPTARADPTLHDALTGTDLLEHLLRPLAARIPAGSVAHAVSSGLATLPALAAKHFDGAPFLLTEHGIYLRERYLGYRTAAQRWPVKALLLGFYRALNSLGYREADLITPCNQYNRRWEERGGAPADRIRTVYNGVDPHLFPHAGPEPEVPTLTWAGRIDPIKDLETLLRAYALARARLPELRLRLFGGVPDGGEEYRTKLEKLAAELGVSDGITFEGRISDVARAYGAGHVVMLSSISEGFPFSILEAMSCGRTTVSTDVGGVREAVGDTGIVVPPREPGAMARAVLGLMADDARRTGLGRLARRRVIDLFTLRRSVEGFREIYHELAGVTQARGPLAAGPVADWTTELRDPWWGGLTTHGAA